MTKVIRMTKFIFGCVVLIFIFYGNPFVSVCGFLGRHFDWSTLWDTVSAQWGSLSREAKLAIHRCTCICANESEHSALISDEQDIEHLFASQIYCQGPILEAVHQLKLFNDSKYFVDMSLKHDPVTTLKHFYELGHSAVTDRKTLIQFVDSHFDPPGSELMECYPEDWVTFPNTFNRIEDYHYRRWALHLHRLWRDLCRKVREKVRIHQELYSLLYVPYPFIIPGGRFREFYYWDSYWIAKGLLVSEMYDTTRGIIRNLASMVENHGFVPNGGRVYYLLRSQPPLLTFMVYDYYLATGDIEFVQELLPMLEKEYKFWQQNRGTRFTEDGQDRFDFFQYRVAMKMPRPESYKEDMDLVRNISSEAEKQLVWSNLASAAETGWDFSSRWFEQTGPHKHDLRSIKTWSIIPVDLNAFMCMNARILASLFEISGNLTSVLVYQARYEQAKAAMRQIHWNEADGIWYDYDLSTRAHVREYYISNALPMFAKCYDDDSTPYRVHQYLKRVGVFNFTRGLPTSLAAGSTQQWDNENAWPPMIHMVIEGFRTSGEPSLVKVAGYLAEQWLKVTYRAFIHTHAMFEKYNVSSSTESYGGSGGEYEVQTGFGWTNGVILDLLEKYGEQISSSASRIRCFPNCASLVLCLYSLFRLVLLR